MFKVSFHPFLSKTMATLLVFAFALGAQGAQPAHAASPGTVVAWGHNTYGQSSVPAELSDVTAISGGSYYSLALKSDGTVFAWGNNFYGQLDIPPGLSDVTAIAAGNGHSLALKSDGTVVAWGCIGLDYGQCNVPFELSDVTAIAAGNGHSLALKSDGTVVGWGCIGLDYGQCNVPFELSDVTAIAAGVHHSLALKSDGTVVAWGRNTYGQSSVPAELSDVTAIAAGREHSLALRGDGTVFAWGSDNFYGQLNIPSGLSDVTAIAVGDDHSVALKGDGTVVAWGGNNIYGPSNVPAELSDVIAIAAGNHHSLVLVSSFADTTPPTVAITTPADGAQYFLGQIVNAAYTCQDEDGGSGLVSCVGNVANGSAIDTSSIGPKSFTVHAVDNEGNPASVTHTYSVVYNFSGFFQPVDNLPTLNTVKAGQAIPIKFSLDGNQGLSIFAAGYPKIEFAACTGVSVDAVETTVTAGNSSLSYDANTDQYTYIWKTDRAWANRCGTLHLKFIDGTTQLILFKFNR